MFQILNWLFAGMFQDYCNCIGRILNQCIEKKMNELFLGKDYHESLGFMELRLMGNLFPANANKYSKYVPAPFRTANVNQTNYQCKIEEPVDWPSASCLLLPSTQMQSLRQKLIQMSFFPPDNCFICWKYLVCILTFMLKQMTKDKIQGTQSMLKMPGMKQASSSYFICG